MTRRLRTVRKVLGLLFLGLGALVFVWGASTSWMLRDSLQAGGAASRGWDAVWRFAWDFSEFFYVSLGFCWAGWYLLRRQPGA